MPDRAAIDEALRACRDKCLSMDAPLSVRLKTMAKEVQRLDPGFTGVIDRLVERLAKAGSGANAPKPGEKMPPFVLPDENGRLTSLAALLERGKLVISLHRGHWCSYCRITAKALAEIERRFARQGGHMVAIVPEKQEYSRALKRNSGLACPVLSDLDSAYALQLGLVFRIGDELKAAYEKDGLELAEFQSSGGDILPIPATFVVGQDGTVVARNVDPDYRRRMETEAILEALA